MFEILVLLALIAWILFSVWLAARIARLVRPTALKALIFVPAALIFISLSVADEIIGKYQFDSLCADLGDVNVFGEIPVGSELYLPDGTWKLRRITQLSFEEFNRTRRIYDSLVRRETAHRERWTEAIPISEFDTKVISQSSGKVLASYRSYGTSGGWLSRRMEKPILVRSQCLPASYDKIDQSVLPYRDAAFGADGEQAQEHRDSAVHCPPGAFGLVGGSAYEFWDAAAAAIGDGGEGTSMSRVFGTCRSTATLELAPAAADI